MYAKQINLSVSIKTAALWNAKNIKEKGTTRVILFQKISGGMRGLNL